MKKSNNKIRNIIIGVSIFLALGFVTFFSLSQNILGSGIKIEHNSEVLPLVKGDFTFQEFNGIYTTPFLGTLTSSGGSDTYVINGDNDGEITISNNIESGNTLILKSSTSTAKVTATNFMVANVILPPGKLTANYDWTGSTYQPCSGSIIFNFGKESERFSSDCGSGKGHTGEGDGSFELILEKEREVEFSIFVNTNGKNQKYQGNLEISFEPTVIVSPVTNDTIIITPEENFDNDFNYANLLFLLIPFAFLLVFFIILKKKSKRGRK